MAGPIKTDAPGVSLVLEWLLYNTLHRKLPLRIDMSNDGDGARVMDSDGVVWVRTAGGWEPEADTPTIVEVN